MATVKDLRAQCKARAIKGYSRLRKADLIEVLAAHGVPQRKRRAAAVCAARVNRSYTLREEPRGDFGMERLAVLEEKISALNALIAEKDVRYNQRFGAQEVAIAAAMNASEKAIAATKAALDTAMLASEKAIVKAEMATEKRFESVNEFRGTLTDQQSTYARKSEVDIRFHAIEEKVSAAITAQLEMAGKGLGFNSAWVMFLGLGTLATGVVLIALRLIGNP